MAKNTNIADHENPTKLSLREQELDRTAKILIRRDLELTAANARLEELDRLKSEFISIAAHQLRTPLSGVKWVFKMLIDGDVGALSKEQKDFLLRGYDSNERMIRLVDDLLNAARIDEGRFAYNKTSFDLRELLKEVTDNFFGIILKKGLKIDYLVPKGDFPKLLADKEKLAIVLDNLMENATNYTPANGQLVIKLLKDNEAIKFSIKDSGIGIPKNQQSQVFNRFFRGENAGRQAPNGSGLGLYISRNIIKAHNGTIGFVSEENQGSEFFFSLPTP